MATPTVFNDRTHVGIGKSGVGMDNCLIKSVILQLTAVVNLHVADHRETIHFGLQGTKAIGEHFGKHRHNPLREVHRVASKAGLLIKRGAYGHIM